MANASELIKLQDSEAVKNSFYRAPKISPTIVAHDTYIEVKTVDTSCKIQKIDETILGIIADFKFAPYWLIQQWFEDFGSNNSFYVVSDWISIGLVWVETSSMGVFIRPTKFLLDMFQIEKQFYEAIPFGLLNHTCSEEQIVFDIQMGNEHSELWQVIKNEELLPCYHPLNIQPQKDNGTIVIREGNFKANRFKPHELIQKDEDLKREIKSGQRYTSEFSDFSLFPIVYVDKDTGELITQTPDVLIPVPRKNGLAQSYAIELELSAKTPNKYIKIMQHYKDNLKFGKLMYLCGTKRIAKMVKDAFQAVKGLGTCELYLMPFAPPALRLENFSMADENDQANMIKLSIKVNK